MEEAAIGRRSMAALARRQRREAVMRAAEGDRAAYTRTCTDHASARASGRQEPARRSPTLAPKAGRKLWWAADRPSSSQPGAAEATAAPAGAMQAGGGGGGALAADAPAPAAATPAAAAAAPSGEHAHRSWSSRLPTTVIFHNSTQRTVEYAWLSFQGERTSYGSLAPGERAPPM